MCTTSSTVHCSKMINMKSKKMMKSMAAAIMIAQYTFQKLVSLGSSITTAAKTRDGAHCCTGLRQ